jgi:hypothetical protein
VKWVGVGLAYEIIIHAIWTIFDRPVSTLKPGSEPFSNIPTCSSDRMDLWLVLLLVPKFLLLIYGSYLAWGVRNVSQNLNESKFIAFAICNNLSHPSIPYICCCLIGLCYADNPIDNLLLVGCVCLPLIVIISDRMDVTFILLTVATLLGVLSPILTLFVPKFIFILWPHGPEDPVSGSTRVAPPGAKRHSISSSGRASSPPTPSATDVKTAVQAVAVVDIMRRVLNDQERALFVAQLPLVAVAAAQEQYEQQQQRVVRSEDPDRVSYEQHNPGSNEPPSSGVSYQPQYGGSSRIPGSMMNSSYMGPTSYMKQSLPQQQQFHHHYPRQSTTATGAQRRAFEQAQGTAGFSNGAVGGAAASTSTGGSPVIVSHHLPGGGGGGGGDSTVTGTGTPNSGMTVNVIPASQRTPQLPTTITDSPDGTTPNGNDTTNGFRNHNNNNNNNNNLAMMSNDGRSVTASPGGIALSSTMSSPVPQQRHHVQQQSGELIVAPHLAARAAMVAAGQQRQQLQQQNQQYIHGGDHKQSPSSIATSGVTMTPTTPTTAMVDADPLPPPSSMDPNAVPVAHSSN